MKEQMGIINNGCFTRTLPSRTWTNKVAGNKTNLKTIFKEARRLTKQFLPTVLAGCGISATILTSLYFFLVQLAEYGL